MDKKKTDILIFLDKWENPNPTNDEWMGFSLCQSDDCDNCSDLGMVIDDGFFSNSGKSQMEIISGLIEMYRPKWVVGLENSATLLLPYHHQRKILINPTVGYDDLNNVPQFAVANTYGFFSSMRMESYGRFKTVYPNAEYIPSELSNQILLVSDLKDVIKRIIGS